MGRKERLKLAFDISGTFLIITKVISLISSIISSIYAFKFYDSYLPLFTFAIPIIMLVIDIVLLFIGNSCAVKEEKILI